MKRTFLILFIFGALVFPTGSAAAPPGASAPTATEPGLAVGFDSVAAGLNQPVDIANAGDGRLFVVERPGVIRIIGTDGSVLPTPFLDITARVDSSSSEEGLLGLAFHPDYSGNGYFYVNYTFTSGTRYTRISRFSVTANPDVADPDSEEILLTVVQHSANHNGGDLNFGPDDYLYFGLGDGGGAGDTGNYAQNNTQMLGKIGRIDVDSGPGNAPDCVGLGTGNYTVPPTPFSDGPGGNCDEIFDTGLRNPWRFSFDPATGDMFIADVGQGSWEEINYAPAATLNGGGGGYNWGWRCYEGDHPFNKSGCGPIGNYDFPIQEYSHSAGRCSVTGGFIYRGMQYPLLGGHYFYADYCSGDVWTLVSDGKGGWTNTLVGDQGFGITTFGEGFDGELYMARGSTIYHITEATTAPAQYRADMSGNNVVPPISSPAKGRTLMRPNGQAIQFKFKYRDIVGGTTVHLHCAPAGQNGPVGVTLVNTSFDGTGQFTGTFAAPDPGNSCGWLTIGDMIADVLAGNVYAQAHTLSNPAGEIRGQVVFPP